MKNNCECIQFDENINFIQKLTVLKRVKFTIRE